MAWLWQFFFISTLECLNISLTFAAIQMASACFGYFETFGTQDPVCCEMWSPILDDSNSPLILFHFISMKFGFKQNGPKSS